MQRPVWLLFVAALVATPLQLVVREVASEPYPGLFQPSFGGVPATAGWAEVREPVLDVRFDDGATVSISHRQLLHDAEVLPLAVFDSAFVNKPERALAPDSVRWIEERVAPLREGAEPVAVEVTWWLVRYPTSGGGEPVREPVNSLTVPLGGS